MPPAKPSATPSLLQKARMTKGKVQNAVGGVKDVLKEAVNK
jgi:hypothetical protein